MSQTANAIGRGRPKGRKVVLALLSTALVGSACVGTTGLPAPRPLVVTSGARLTADPEKIQEIYDLYIPQDDAITNDPTFWIDNDAVEQDTYPWETLVLQGDTARYQNSRSNPDVVGAYNIYAHLHLMKKLNRLNEWLPDLANADEKSYQLERAIVERMADSWLLGRSVFDAQPHPLLDELIYAKEAGHLDAFLFTARPNDWATEREAWVREHPQGLDEYRAWFRQTMGGEPPGIRTRNAAARGG
jgi:hypothetical protein